MMISLVGYSGIGKTLLARRLEHELGWLRLSCDELIEERLNGELEKIPGTGEARLATWMGFPWEKDSRARQELYLLVEEQVLDEVCDTLEESLGQPASPNIVVDTTGSCIYLAHDVIKRLRKFSRVIFVDASKDEEAALLQRYFSFPKPIIWGDVFQQQANETHEEAIRRCYPMLLNTRRALYEQIADAHLFLDPETRTTISGEKLLEQIQLQIGPDSP